MSENPYSAPLPASSPDADDAVLRPLRRKTPRHPRVWPTLLTMPVCWVFFIAASALALVIAGIIHSMPIHPRALADADRLSTLLESPLALMLTILLPQVALAVPAVVVAALSSTPLRQRLELVRGNWPLWLWGTAALGAPIIGMISSIIVSQFMGESESLDRMSDMFRRLGEGGYLIPLALLVGLMPGICEELVFRGFLQTRLVAAWGAAGGIVIASIIFGIFHMDPVHSTAVVALGIYLGWVAWASGTVFTAMATHFFNNFLSVLAVVLLPESATEGVAAVTEDVTPAIALVLLGGIAISSICLIVTLRAAKRFPRPDEQAVAQ